MLGLDWIIHNIVEVLIIVLGVDIIHNIVEVHNIVEILIIVLGLDIIHNYS